MPENKDEIYDSGGELFWATKDNRSDIVRALLDRDAEVDAKRRLCPSHRPLHRNEVDKRNNMNSKSLHCRINRILFAEAVSRPGKQGDFMEGGQAYGFGRTSSRT